jgi:hypothetical protein
MILSIVVVDATPCHTSLIVADGLVKIQVIGERLRGFVMTFRNDSDRLVCRELFERNTVRPIEPCASLIAASGLNEEINFHITNLTILFLTTV